MSQEDDKLRREAEAIFLKRFTPDGRIDKMDPTEELECERFKQGYVDGAKRLQDVAPEFVEMTTEEAADHGKAFLELFGQPSDHPVGQFDGQLARKAFHAQKSTPLDDAHSFEEGARWHHEQSRTLVAALRTMIEFQEKQARCQPDYKDEYELMVKERDAARAEAERLTATYNRRYSENLENENGELRQERDRLKSEVDILETKIARLPSSDELGHQIALKERALAEVEQLKQQLKAKLEGHRKNVEELTRKFDATIADYIDKRNTLVEMRDQMNRREQAALAEVERMQHQLAHSFPDAHKHIQMHLEERDRLKRELADYWKCFAENKVRTKDLNCMQAELTAERKGSKVLLEALEYYAGKDAYRDAESDEAIRKGGFFPYGADDYHIVRTDRCGDKARAAITAYKAKSEI